MTRRGWAVAEDAFREALRLAPQEPVYQSNLAVALERRGRRREAMQHFRGAVRTDPGNPAVSRQLVHAIERRLATVCIVAAAVGIAAVAFVLDLGRPVTWAIAGGIGAGMVGTLVLLRWWRLRQLDETLRTFYRHERRRWRALRRDLLVWAGAAAAASLAAVVAAWLVSRSWPVALAAAVLVAALVRYPGRHLWLRELVPRLQARHRIVRVR
jgi:MFS family permease